MIILPIHISTEEGSTSAQEGMELLPIILSKLLGIYVPPHNTFNVNDDDIEPDKSRFSYNRETCQHFKIHSLNIFHMMTHFDELKLFIETNKPDIIGVSETKLDKTVDDCDVGISGYRAMRKDRNCYGGDVLMYISESLNFNHREDLDFDLESITVEIKVGKYKLFLVTTIYRPPDKPVACFDQIESLISTTELERKESILVGDLIVTSYVSQITTPKILKGYYLPMVFPADKRTNKNNIRY